MIRGNENSEKMKKYGKSHANIFSENLRIMLSSYTQAINKQEQRTGSLFQQNTKRKAINDIYLGRISKPDETGYDYFCFHYIHNNPVKAGLVNKKEDWEFSSYLDYVGLRNGTLLSKTFALESISMDIDLFTQQKNLDKLFEN